MIIKIKHPLLERLFGQENKICVSICKERLNRGSMLNFFL